MDNNPQYILFEWKSLQELVSSLLPPCKNKTKHKGFIRGRINDTECGKPPVIRVDTVKGFALRLAIGCGTKGHEEIYVWSSSKANAADTADHFAINKLMVLAALNSDMRYEKLKTFSEIIGISLFCQKTFDTIRENAADAISTVMCNTNLRQKRKIVLKIHFLIVLP